MAKDRVIDLSSRYDASKNPKQWRFHQATERYKLYGGAYGGGKTATLCNEGIALSIDYPGNRGFLGCREAKAFRDNALKQLEKFLPAELIATHHKTEMYFHLVNGSVIMYGGLGNDEEAIKKISNMPELGWFGIDQAEQITERQFLLLDGRLRLVLPGIRYYALLTANPEPGWLRDRFIENPPPDHIFIPALPKDNPFLAEGYEEKLKKQYPEALARRMLEGDWDVDLQGSRLIPYNDIRGAVNRVLEPEGDVVIGADIAWRGSDEFVVVIRQGNKVLRVASWSGEESHTSTGRLIQFINEYKPKVTNLESVGVGAGIFDGLKRAGFNIAEFWGSIPAKNDKVYANKRAEAYFNLANKFKEGTIDIPDHVKLQPQLNGITFGYAETSYRLKIDSKEILRKTMGCSPDYADALMLAFVDALTTDAKPIKTLSFTSSQRTPDFAEFR